MSYGQVDGRAFRTLLADHLRAVLAIFVLATDGAVLGKMVTVNLCRRGDVVMAAVGPVNASVAEENGLLQAVGYLVITGGPILLVVFILVVVSGSSLASLACGCGAAVLVTD